MKKAITMIGSMALAIVFLGACETPDSTSKSTAKESVPEPETSKSVAQEGARSSAAKTSEATAAKTKTQKGGDSGSH